MRGVTTLIVVLLTAAPYQADSGLPYETHLRVCRNSKKEYSAVKPNGGTALMRCCSRCPPGTKLKVTCNETADSECEPCPRGQYMEGWNYKPHCFTCVSCSEDKGLQYLQNCTRSTKSRCGCQPGMYCDVGFNNPYCSECEKYSLCQLGFGVSVQGTADSDARCSPCPDGTFSDVVSHTESCKPQTRCPKAVVEQGTATSDTVCDPPAPAYSVTRQSHPTPEAPSTVGYTTASTVVYATTGLLTTTIPVKTDSTLTPVQSPPPVTTAAASINAELVVVPSVISCVFLVITILVVLWKCKIIHWKGSQKLELLTDANGNSQQLQSMHHQYAVDAQITSLAVPREVSHEQSLMAALEPCTDLSDAPDKPLARIEDPRGTEEEALV